MGEKGKNSFAITISPLLPNTKYYWRAFVVEGDTYYYGDIKEFTTKALEVSVATGEATKITGSSATLSGIVNGLEANPTYTYGVLIAPENNPVPKEYQATSNENGNFSVVVNSLTEGMTYNWMAYAKDATGYKYGIMKHFVAKKTENKERDILIAFYEATGGENWTNNTNWCSEQPLSEWYGVSLDLEGKVRVVDLPRNNLTGEGSLAGLESMISAQFIGNHLTGLNLSNCSSLETLECRENRQITTLNLSGCIALNDLYVSENQINSLELSDCINLKLLYCEKNQLTTLDLSKNTLLENLHCSNNVLNSINIRECTNLVWLFIGKNQIQGELNVSNFQNLRGLDLTSNQFTSINASNCPVLEYIICATNQLKTVNIKGCSKMAIINSTGNQIETFYLDKVPSSFKYDTWMENGNQYPLFIYE